jgi:predicted ArsR family transcriptional regulator
MSVHNSKDHVKALALRAKASGRPLDDVLHEDKEMAEEVVRQAEEATGRPVNMLRHTVKVETREDVERLIKAFDSLGYDTETLKKIRDCMS